MTLQLSVLEDSFNRLLSEAVELENQGLYKYDNDVAFCFVRCTNQDLISEAETMEQQGYDCFTIFQRCHILRDAYGRWKQELNTSEFRYYAEGKRPAGNNKLKKPNGNLEGKLTDFISFKSLFERYPQLKNVGVVVKKAHQDTVRLIIGDKKLTLFINIELSSKYKTGEYFEIKSQILRELQKAVQYINGEYIGKSLESWQESEKEGNTPYSKRLGRKLSAEEAYKYTADNFERNIAETRQWFRDMVTKTNNYKDMTLETIDDAVIYQPFFHGDMLITFDENKKPVIVREYLISDKSKSDSQRLDETSTKIQDDASKHDNLTLEHKDEESTSKHEDDSFLFDNKHRKTSFENALEEKENSNKLKKLLFSTNRIAKNLMNKQFNIKVGSDELISDVADNAQQAADYFNKKKITELSQMALQRVDTVGRKLSEPLWEKMQETIFKNHKGKLLSLYALKMSGIGGFEHSKLGLAVGTLEAAKQLYSEYNEGSSRNRDFYIQELFVNMKNPLVLHYTPYEDSIRGIHDLVEREVFFYNEFVKLTTSKSAAFEPRYNGITTRKTRDAIKAAGYDGVIYFNDSTDKGSMTVLVFDEEQIVKVSENGILLDNNGVTDDYFDLAAAEAAAENIDNSESIKLFSADRFYKRRTTRPVPDERIKAGSSGFMEKIVANAEDAIKYLNKAIKLGYNVRLSGKDTAGRKLANNIKTDWQNTFFKDKYGDLLSVFAYGKKEINLSAAVKSRTMFGTLNSAISEFAKIKEKEIKALCGIVQEFYIYSEAPIIIKLDEWNTEEIAKQLFEKRIFSEKEFYKAISGEQKNPALMLTKTLDRKGYDSLIFVKENGEYAVVPFNEKQILPVANNGVLKDNGDIIQISEKIDSNDNKYNIDRVVIQRERKVLVEVQAIRDIISLDCDNTIKLKLLTKVLMCQNDPAIDYFDDRTAGNSGIFEKNKIDLWNACAIVKAMINRDLSNISISNIDTAGRKVREFIKMFLSGSIMIDGYGRPLSVFAYNRHGDNRFKHSQFGLRVGTLNAAHDISLNLPENKLQNRRGFFEEYYAIIKNPYHIMFDPIDLTPAKLAEYLHKEGIITNLQYNRVLSFHGAYEATYGSFASNYLTKLLIEKGFDSISFMNERDDPGSIGFIVFDKSQLIPVTIDGLPVENSDRTLADSKEPAFLMPENDDENFVENGDENEIDSQEDKGYNEIKKVKCRNERLEGDNHSVTNIPFVKKQIDVNGKTIEVVVPEFDSIFDAQLPEQLYQASNRTQSKECYSQLRRELKKNIALRKRFTEKELKSLEKGRRLDNYTWHHDVVLGRMQLVNRYIHIKTGHTGGQYFWGGGTINR